MSNTQRDSSPMGMRPSARTAGRLQKSQSPSPKKNGGSVDKPERETRGGFSQTDGGPKIEFNFKIVIRIRPMIMKEIKNKEKNCLTVQNDMIRLADLQYEELLAEQRHHLGILQRSKERYYKFDQIFQEQSTIDIFNICVKSQLDFTLAGMNSCVFAFGATGSGKTYTMFGKDITMSNTPPRTGKKSSVARVTEQGLIECSAVYLFEQIARDTLKEFNVIASCLEIYNETVIDLLRDPSHPVSLELWDDADQGLLIPNLVKVNVGNLETFLTLLKLCKARKRTAKTRANERSSRSHTILQLNILSHPKNIDSADPDLANLIVPSKINFVDLSGAERGVTDEGNQKTIDEGTQINKSLFALSKCINALTKAGRNIGMVYVPYRDSKLTRFLKDSLGGTTRTTMICHISPSSSRFNESSATLKYAEMAKMIPVLPKESIRQFKELQEQEYRRMVHELRQELDHMKSKNSPSPIMEEFDPVPDRRIPEPKPNPVPVSREPSVVRQPEKSVSVLSVVRDKPKTTVAQPYYAHKETKQMLSALKQENDMRELLESDSTRQMLLKLTALLDEEVDLKKNLSDLEAHNKMNDLLKKRYKERIARAVGDHDVEWVNDVYNELKQSDEHNEYVRDMLLREIKDNRDKLKSFVEHAERELGEAKAHLLFKDLLKVRDERLARVEMETSLRLYESLNKKLLDKVFEATGPATTSRDQPPLLLTSEAAFRPRGHEEAPSTVPEFNLETSDKRKDRNGQASPPDMELSIMPTPKEDHVVRPINSDVFDMDADVGNIDPRKYELKGIKDQLKDPSKNRYIAEEGNEQMMSDSEVNLEGTIFNQLLTQEKQASVEKIPKLAADRPRPENHKQDATVPKYASRERTEESRSILDRFQRPDTNQDPNEIMMSTDNYLGRLDDPTSATKMLIGQDLQNPKPRLKLTKPQTVASASLPINLHTEAQSILASAGLDEASAGYLWTEPLANPERETAIKFGVDGEQVVRWNLNVAWGEEYKLYLGGQGYECFPETKSVFEAEILVHETDFLAMLDPKEMALFESMLPKKEGKKNSKPAASRPEKENSLEFDNKKSVPKQRNLLAQNENADKGLEHKPSSTRQLLLPDLRGRSKERTQVTESELESPEDSKARRTGSILDQFLPESKERRKLQTQSSFEKQINASNQNGPGIYSLSQSRPGTQTHLHEGSRQVGSSKDPTHRRPSETSEEAPGQRNAKPTGVKLPKLKPIPQHQLSYNLSAGENFNEEKSLTGGDLRSRKDQEQESVSYKPKGYDAGPNYQDQDDQGILDFDLDDRDIGMDSNIQIDVDDIDTDERKQHKDFSAADTRKYNQKSLSQQSKLEESLKEDFKKKFSSKFPQA